MSHNPCESRQEDIVALAIGELDLDRAGELLSHLETCPECRSLYEEVVESEVFVQATFAKIGKALEPAQADLPPIDRPVLAARPMVGAARRIRVQRWKWTPAKVVALAAVILLAATGLFSRLHLTSPSFGATFATVLHRLQKARTVTYKQKVEVDGQEPLETCAMAMHPGCVRYVTPSGVIFIRDYADGREMCIDPAKGVARLILLARRDSQRLGHYLEWVSTLHDADGVFVGQQDLDGRKTNVFHVNRPFEQFRVWADVQTDLPVRVEWVQSPCLDKGIKVPDLSLCVEDFQNAGDPAEESSATGTSTILGGCSLYVTAPGVREEKMTTTMTDFAWDAPLDETLFQVAAPQGLQVGALDFGKPATDEEALIAALRFWAETSGGAFPADINMLQDVHPKLIRKFATGRPANEDYADAVKMAYVVAYGMLFAQQLKAVDNWHYFGQNVKAGEAHKPLCWWKLEHRDIYRVIYGDLTIRDVPPAEVPQPTGPTSQAAPAAPVGAAARDS